MTRVRFGTFEYVPMYVDKTLFPVVAFTAPIGMGEVACCFPNALAELYQLASIGAPLTEWKWQTEKKLTTNCILTKLYQSCYQTGMWSVRRTLTDGCYLSARATALKSNSLRPLSRKKCCSSLRSTSIQVLRTLRSRSESTFLISSCSHREFSYDRSRSRWWSTAMTATSQLKR